MKSIAATRDENLARIRQQKMQLAGLQESHDPNKDLFYNIGQPAGTGLVAEGISPQLDTSPVRSALKKSLSPIKKNSMVMFDVPVDGHSPTRVAAKRDSQMER